MSQLQQCLEKFVKEVLNKKESKDINSAMEQYQRALENWTKKDIAAMNGEGLHNFLIDRGVHECDCRKVECEQLVKICRGEVCNTEPSTEPENTRRSFCQPGLSAAQNEIHETNDAFVGNGLLDPDLFNMLLGVEIKLVLHGTPNCYLSQQARLFRDASIVGKTVEKPTKNETFYLELVNRTEQIVRIVSLTNRVVTAGRMTAVPNDSGTSCTEYPQLYTSKLKTNEENGYTTCFRIVQTNSELEDGSGIGFRCAELGTNPSLYIAASGRLTDQVTAFDISQPSIAFMKDNPGHFTPHVLVIGRSGVGKSSLINAIGESFNENFEKQQVAVSGGQCTKDFKKLIFAEAGLTLIDSKGIAPLGSLDPYLKTLRDIIDVTQTTKVNKSNDDDENDGLNTKPHAIHCCWFISNVSGSSAPTPVELAIQEEILKLGIPLVMVASKCDKLQKHAMDSFVAHVKKLNEMIKEEGWKVPEVKHAKVSTPPPIASCPKCKRTLHENKGGKQHADGTPSRCTECNQDFKVVTPQHDLAGILDTTKKFVPEMTRAIYERRNRSRCIIL